jgi:PTH1 family peptidyl-tRNA hydrolase
MKYLIVGLGNIGQEYTETRHNIGFKILDAFAKASNIFFTQDRFGQTTQFKYKGRTLILLKPDTYMNLSGKAVQFWMQKENIPISNILIITDDLSLPFGKLRIRTKGSDGGHNGLKNIIECLQTNEFPRLRFGIANDFDKGKQINYVLGNWNSNELEIMPSRIDLCMNAIKDFSFVRMNDLMTVYNSK